MRNVWIICRKELGSYFSSLLAYVVISVFLVLSAFFFYTNLSFFVTMGGFDLNRGLWQYQFHDMRLVLLLKANGLARGHSGVRREVIEMLLKLYAADALPVIPAKGSVGASGDLAPLAHMTAAMIGQGGIKLKGDDRVVGGCAVAHEEIVVIATEAGYA